MSKIKTQTDQNSPHFHPTCSPN